MLPSCARRETLFDAQFDILVIGDFAKNRTEAALAMDRARRRLKLARDIIVMTPDEFERDREIPGTIARPAAMEGRIRFSCDGLIPATGDATPTDCGLRG